MTRPLPAAALHTTRLRLVPPAPALAVAVADYYRRNADHLAPWEPRRADLTHPAVQAATLASMSVAHRQDLSWRWFLQPREGADVIGSVALSGVVRGFHHSANLGYGLDGAWQGQGVMHEALEAVLQEAFGPTCNLHRVQAGCLPHNERSLRLLRRLGFREIGLATAYLRIAGRWQDHLLLERLNPGFQDPPDAP